ncbi:MAG: isoprenylcysteine carboxylmethyltransferase family protein [Candidatus Nanopelagicales bacterium]
MTDDGARFGPGAQALGWVVVVVQLALLGLLALAGVVPALHGPDLPGPGAAWVVVGAVLLAVGAVFAVTGLVGLGSSLTATPVPLSDASLRTGGAYAWVRHPVYTGLLAGGLGWALVTRSTVGVGLWLALLVLLAVKSRWEERMLAARYPDYAAYAARTPRLVPYRRPRGVPGPGPR